MVRRLLRWASPLVALVALLFIWLLVRSHWADLRTYEWRLHWGWFGVATALLLASWSIEIEIWRRGLRVVGGRIGYFDAVRIWFLSAVVRYVPGNIWQPLSMTLYCRRLGVRAESTLASILLFQVVVVLAVLPFVGMFLAWSERRSLLTDLLDEIAAGFAVVVLVPVVVFLVRPVWMIQLMNWALARMGREPLQLTLSSGQLVGLLAMAIFHWTVWGATFVAFALSLGGLDGAEITRAAPNMILAYPIGYGVGFAAFFTPSGLGAREGAYYVLLVPLLDGVFVTVIALAMRLWTVVGEVVMAAICFLAGGRRLVSLPAPAEPGAMDRVPGTNFGIIDAPEIPKSRKS